MPDRTEQPLALTAADVGLLRGHIDRADAARPTVVHAEPDHYHSLIALSSALEMVLEDAEVRQAAAAERLLDALRAATAADDAVIDHLAAGGEPDGPVEQLLSDWRDEVQQ